MKKRMCLVAIIGVMIMSCGAADAFAWDGERKGFLLGAGAGSGFSSVNQEVSGLFTASERWNKMPLRGNFAIGFAPNNRWSVYFAQIYNSMVVNGERAYNGFQGLAVRYYTRDQEKSVVFSGGIGLGDFGGVDGFDIRGTRGLGLFAGVGYEFARHWSLEGDLMYTTTNESEFGIDADTRVIGFVVSLNALGY